MKLKNKISISMLGWCLMFVSLLSSSMSRALFRFVALERSPYTPEQLLAAQCLVGTVMLFIFLKVRKQEFISTTALGLQMLRALIAVIAYHFLLISLKLFPLYISTLIGLSTVFFTTLGSVIFIEHQWPARNIMLGSVLGVVGSLLSLQRLSEVRHYHDISAPIWAAVLFTLSSLILKRILLQTQKEAPLQHLFSLLLFMSLFLLPSFHSLTTLVEIVSLPSTLFLAILYLLSQGTYIAAYQKAALSSLSAMKFLKIPLAAFWDYTAFGHGLSYSDMAAAGLISVGILLSKPSALQAPFYKKTDRRPQVLGVNHTRVLS